MKQKFYFVRLVTAFILLLLVAEGQAQGYLRDDSVTTYTSGVVLTEFAGFGNPAFDFNGDGAVNSGTDEYIEWTNTANVAINIGGWKFDDGSNVGHTVPANTILGPGKKVIMFMNTTTVPSNFNGGFGNYVCATGSASNGINNSGDAIGVANASGRYTYIRWKTAAGSYGNLNAFITTGNSLGANTIPEVNNMTTYTGAILCNGAGGLSNHSAVTGIFNWSNASNTVTNPTGTPGRHTDGYAIETPAPSTAPGITFGTITANTIPISALTNTQKGHRRIIVIKDGSAVTFTPSDSVTYTGINTNFNTATDQGSGNKIVMDDTTTVSPLTVTGLSPSTTYHFAVYEYNGNTPSSDRNYRTASGVATNNTTTSASSTPTVNLSVSAASGTEAATTIITVTATASSAVASTETVDLGVSGTGITSGDYTLSNTQITITSGNTIGTVTFTVKNDTLGEGTETAILAISNPSSGLTLGSTVQKNISITDNEPSLSISFSVGSATEGGSVISIFGTLSDTILTSIQSANLAISGTGVTAGDYSLSKTAFSFDMGEVSDTIFLTVADDNVRESAETFIHTISALSSRIWASSTTANLLVNDNDDAISITALNTYLPADTFDNVIATPSSQMYRGWYFFEHGSNANTSYDTTSGVSTTGNMFSLGSALSQERALGSLNSSALDTTYFGAKYINNSGSDLNTLIISYVGEMWRYQGSTDKLDFQYSLNATSVSDASATWTDANALDFSNPNTTSGSLNGNSPTNRTIFTNIAVALSSNVANGNSFWIRFRDVDIPGSDAILGIDSFVLKAKNSVTTIYYSNASGDLDQTTTWGINTDGSGANPTNFTDDDQRFVIQNNNNATIAANWTVSGINSKVVCGDSSNAITFTIPSTFTFSGTIDVKYNATLKLQNTTLPAFGVLELGSTVEYNQASTVTVLNSANYGNLTLSGAGTKAISTGTTVVNNNINLNNVAISFSGVTTMTLGGNFTVSGTLTQTDTTQTWGITTVGNGNQTISGNNNKIYIFRLIATKTAGSLNISNAVIRMTEDYRLNFSNTATFNDGGNELWCGDDFQADGISSAYTLTGTVVMRQNASTANFEQNTAGGTIVAQLNNIVWNTTGAGSGSFGGSSPIYINGNMTVTNVNSGNINLGSKILYIKGNWINNRTTDVITEATSKVYFVGTTAQTISSAFASGEIFNDIIIDNTNGVNTTTRVTANDSLILTNGQLNTSSIVILPSSGVVYRTNGWVNGQLRKNFAIGASVANIYEIGDASAYTPVNITLNNVTVSGNLTLAANQTNNVGTVYANVCVDTNKTLDRLWTLAKTDGLDFDNYNGTFTYTGNDTTNGGASSQLIQAYIYDGITVEKSTMGAITSSTFAITSDTLTGTLYVGENRNITASFTKSTPTPCLSSNITLTYTGTGVGTSNYSWSLSGASIVSGSVSGPYTINWGSTGVKPLSLTVTGLGCASSTSYDTVTVFANGWIGSVDTLWTRAANWCSGTVPTSSSNIVIPAGLTNYPTLHATANCGDLTIASGASLKIVSGGNLTVNGVYTNNGTFTHVSGYLNLAATTNIPAGNYFALRLNSASAATYTLSGDINVANVFLMTGSSSNVLNTNGYNVNLYNDVTINSTVNGTGNLNFVKTSGYQTITGVNGVTNINNAVFNNAVSGGTRIYHSMKIENATLTQGTVLINTNVTLTIGSSGCTSCDIITTGGMIQGGNSSTTANLVIEGGASAARITNLKYSSNGSLTLNRVNGVTLGANMLVGNTTTLNNGATIDMNGYNLQVGTTSQALGIITTNSGTIKNNNATGLLSILGNASAPAITNLVLDTMRNVTLNRPNGLSLGSSFVLNGAATLANGDVDLNGKVVLLSSTASISETANQTFKGDSGYIATSRVFSTALSNNNIAGMGLKLSTNAAPGLTYIVRGHQSFASMSGSSIKRGFAVSVTNNVTATVFEMNYDSTELEGADRGKLRLNKSVNSGATWTDITGCTPSTANAATGTIKRNNIALTGTTLFTASDSANTPLSPVFATPSQNTSSEINSSQVSVYPNPFNTEFTLDMNVAAGQYQVVLSDLNGKTIMNQNKEINENNTRMLVPTENLAGGVYFLTLIGNNSKQTMKVIKY